MVQFKSSNSKLKKNKPSWLLAINNEPKLLTYIRLNGQVLIRSDRPAVRSAGDVPNGRNALVAYDSVMSVVLGDDHPIQTLNKDSCEVLGSCRL